MNKKIQKSKVNDISIACGVLPIFDDFEKIITNMIHFSKKRVKYTLLLYLIIIPLDVYVKYKKSINYNKKYLESGWNIFLKTLFLNF